MPRTRMAASARIAHVGGLLTPVSRFMMGSAWSRRAGDPAISDCVVGNPHELPLPGFSAALGRWSAPQSADWYAYKNNKAESRAVVAASLRERRGLPFEEEDVFLTNGAFAAIAVVLGAVTDPGDEVMPAVVLLPRRGQRAPAFRHGGEWPHADRQTACSTARMRTGDEPVFGGPRASALRTTACSRRCRERAVPAYNMRGHLGCLQVSGRQPSSSGGHPAGSSARAEKPLGFSHGECHSRILFDGREYVSPTSYYPESFLLYTYGKTLLTPGQRLGYIALPPAMPEREQLRPPSSSRSS